MVDKAPDRARRENKYERFQKVLIGSGIGGSITAAEKMCAMTHASAAQSVSWHTYQGLALKSWNLEKILDPSEIRAKKISQGRQDLQDHQDRKV